MELTSFDIFHFEFPGWILYHYIVSAKLYTQLQELADLQDKLNTSIDANWKENRNLQDWIRTTWTECAELMQSLPWCWWKDIQTPDDNNIAVELVDIMHMVLSYVILSEYQGKEKLLKFFSQELSSTKKNKKVAKMKSEPEKLVFLIEQVARYFLNYQPKEGLEHFAIAIKETVGFQKIYKLYVGKNILNHLRQEFGYKIGKYKKVIDGREDNAFLMDYVNEGLELEEIKGKLETLLAQHNKRVKKIES